MDTLEELANALRQKAWDEFLFECQDREVGDLWLREPEATRAMFNAVYDFMEEN